LTGKRVLVTGGHKRLGRAIAQTLAAAGADVAISWRKDEAAARATVAELQACGVRALAVRAELTETRQVARLIAEVADQFGGLDGVVASAASWRTTPLQDLDAATLDQVLAENARAPVDLLLQAWPWLRRSADGRAIVVGDLAGVLPYRDRLGHSMAKAALHAAVRGLAAELAPTVIVNAVVPGAVLAAAEDAATWSQRLQRVPMAPLAVADPQLPVAAVCDTVRWLASCPRYVTGQLVAVDGGRLAHW
jgi:3-oxoacyl-[acyl-carrier protein] reductase/pteridine reductase